MLLHSYYAVPVSDNRAVLRVGRLTVLHGWSGAAHTVLHHTTYSWYHEKVPTFIHLNGILVQKKLSPTHFEAVMVVKSDITNY